jgi:hypothetical protein
MSEESDRVREQNDTAPEGSGPLQVVPGQVRAILVEVLGGPSPELDNLRTIAEGQWVPLHVRILEGGTCDDACPTLCRSGPAGRQQRRYPLLPAARAARRQGLPYSPENELVFLSSARHKYELTPVIGPHGEQGPVLPDALTIPELCLEHLPTGETIYRLAEKLPEGGPVHPPEGSAAPATGSVAKGMHATS